MSIKHRLEKLERHPRARGQVVIAVCYNGDYTKPTAKQQEAAIASYKAKHPEWEKGDFIVLHWKNGQYET